MNPTANANSYERDTSDHVAPYESDHIASDELCRAAERFLHREARLLDTERLADWLKEMVDPEISYRVVSRQLRYRNEHRYPGRIEVRVFDDNYEFLKTRVDQFHSGMQWRLDPPERYRRLITNIEAFESGQVGDLKVRSNCLTTRARRAYELDQFVYCRQDVLRRGPEGAFRLLERHIDFDERSISGRNLLLIL